MLIGLLLLRCRLQLKVSGTVIFHVKVATSKNDAPPTFHPQYQLLLPCPQEWQLCDIIRHLHQRMNER